MSTRHAVKYHPVPCSEEPEPIEVGFACEEDAIEAAPKYAVMDVYGTALVVEQEQHHDRDEDGFSYDWWEDTNTIGEYDAGGNRA